MKNLIQHDAFDTVENLHRPDIKTSHVSQRCSRISADMQVNLCGYMMVIDDDI